MTTTDTMESINVVADLTILGHSAENHSILVGKTEDCHYFHPTRMQTWPLQQGEHQSHYQRGELLASDCPNQTSQTISWGPITSRKYLPVLKLKIAVPAPYPINDTLLLTLSMYLAWNRTAQEMASSVRQMEKLGLLASTISPLDYLKDCWQFPPGATTFSWFPNEWHPKRFSTWDSWSSLLKFKDQQTKKTCYCKVSVEIDRTHAHTPKSSCRVPYPFYLTPRVSLTPLKG